MSLYGALFSGVSGLQSQSSAMGAIADNVTNVNTVGYKRTEVQFQTLVTAQVSSTAYSAGGVQSVPRGGVDIQGLLQATTSATDISISGQGFFIVNEAANPESGDIFAYTRAGSFKVDEDGYLQNTSGWYLQGWPLRTWDNSTQAVVKTIGNDVFMKAYNNEDGDTVYVNDNIVNGTNLQPLNLNTIGGTATATTTIGMGANLPSSDDPGDSHKTDILIYDSLGNAHNINHTWVKRASNAWDYTVIPPKGSERILIEDQTTSRQNYYSAGRLDFLTIPDTGTSASFTINSSTFTVNFTTADDTDVLTQTISLSAQPLDGDTFTLEADGNTTVFEFNNGSPNTITFGAVPATGETYTVSIGGVSKVFEFTDGTGASGSNIEIDVATNNTTTLAAAALATALETELDSEIGAGTYASSSGAVVSLKNIPGATALTTVDGTGGDVTDTEFTSGRTPVTIGPNVQSTTSNLASAINTQLTTDLGTASQQWATVNGSTVTVNLTKANQSSQVISLAGSLPNGTNDITIDSVPSDGDAITMYLNGVAYTVGFSTTGTTQTGWDAVINTTTNNTTTLAANAYQALIEAQMDTTFGAAAYTSQATNVITIDDTVIPVNSAINFAEQTSSAVTLASTVNPGSYSTTADTTLDINITDRSLSQIMDELAERLQAAALYEYGGTPLSPPDAWATRLAGESSVYFIQGSAANDITVDASGLTTNGVAAVMQTESFTVDSLDASVAWIVDGNYAIEFNGDGTPDKFFGSDEATASDPRAQYQIAWANGADDMDGSTTPALSVGLGNYNTADGMTQFAGSYQINYISQNGASFGNFAGVSIGEDGVVTALFDNGVTRPVFMVPVATLVNPNGMTSLTGNVWIETDASGQPTVREANDGGAGSVASAALEASTVDLGEEFTAMITTQRAYSASTKIITTTDEMLEELMRAKR